MRSKSYGMIKDISKEFCASKTLEMFRKMCLSRYFEFNVKEVYDDTDLIKMPVYLSVGQESIAAAVSTSFPGAHIYGQHRCHDLYLSYGADIVELIDELLHRPTGCARGMGGSASIHSPKIHMFGHDGLMGTQVPIAVGYALGKDHKTLAVMGDASSEEGYVQGALGEAVTKNAPVLFICSDNNLSVLTEVEVRRCWTTKDMAAAKKIPAVEITDDPWLIMHHVEKFKNQLPAFINIHYSRILWHAGTGIDGEPEWDRFAMVKKELQRLGLGDQSQKIEKETKEYMSRLWKERLEV